MRAYELPLVATEDEALLQMRQFRNTIELECYKAELE